MPAVLAARGWPTSPFLVTPADGVVGHMHPFDMLSYAVRLICAVEFHPGPSPNTPTALFVPTKTLPPAIVGTENLIPSPKLTVLLNSSV